MLGRIQGCHLYGSDGLQALGNGVAYNTVHVAFVHKCSRMAIIRTQNDIAGVDSPLGYGFDLGRHIIPGRTQPQHGAHALPHAGKAIVYVGTLMVISGASGHIGMERVGQIW